MVALDANTGKQIWKTYVVSEPKPTKKNSKGVQNYAPAGGSVWNTPTVDPKHNAIYFGTGDAETEPAPDTTDAIMAVDLKTGKQLWHYQAQANDAFLGGCNGASKTDNCPSENGPDLDIGNSPILRTLPNGKRMLIAATKDGNVIALDPDKNGAVVWHVNVAPKPKDNSFPSRLGGIVWGGAADDKAAYYGLSAGAMVAVQLADRRERLWFTNLAPEGKRVSNAAATTEIPGVAFVGGTDGKMHALSTADGKVVWEYDTAHEFRDREQGAGARRRHRLGRRNRGGRNVVRRFGLRDHGQQLRQRAAGLFGRVILMFKRLLAVAAFSGAVLSAAPGCDRPA